MRIIHIIRVQAFGLALSKEIVNLHHGIIRAESPEGQGAVFIVELLLGKDHYRPSEVDFYVSDTETAPAATDKKMVIDSEKEPEEELEIDASLPTLLLVEDNERPLPVNKTAIGR